MPSTIFISLSVSGGHRPGSYMLMGQGHGDSASARSLGELSSHHCTYCSKVFMDQWSLKRHMRIHTGEKPYKCDICDFRCSQKSNLTNHKWNRHERFKHPLPDP